MNQKSIITASLVSIVLPVYNGETLLPDCLNSLINQTYTNLEIIVIDDLSKDNTWKILREYQKRDKRIRVFHNKKHYGPTVCYNRAIARARGQFITFMNAADQLALTRLKRQVNFLLANPRTVAVGTQYTNILTDGKRLTRSSLPLEPEEIYKTLLHRQAVKPETLLINRQLLPKDILRFAHNKYPLFFTQLFVKFFQYGQIANLPQSYYYHRLDKKMPRSNKSSLAHALSISKVWLTSITDYNYRPSLRSLVEPALRGMPALRNF